MSYRSFKHLLGETSLERKCRFIFGGGILVLVSCSFYWYGRKTESLVIGQTNQAARMLVTPTLMNLHYKSLGNKSFDSIIDFLWDDLTPLDDLPSYDKHILNPYKPRDPKASLSDDEAYERKLMARFLRSASAEESYRKAGTPHPKPYTFGDGTPTWHSRVVSKGNNQKEYQYVQAVQFKPGCLMDCHSAARTTSTTTSCAQPRGASGSRSRPATSPGWSRSTCRWSRPTRRSTTTGPC